MMTADRFLRRIEAAHPGIIEAKINDIREGAVALNLVVDERSVAEDVHRAVDQMIGNLRPELPASVRIFVKNISSSRSPWMEQTHMRINEAYVPLEQYKQLRAEIANVRLEKESLKTQLRQSLIARDDIRDDAEKFMNSAAVSATALAALVGFVAGLNLQDHPVDEQRTAARLVRAAMKALQPERAELKPPQHAWMKSYHSLPPTEEKKK